MNIPDQWYDYWKVFLDFMDFVHERRYGRRDNPPTEDTRFARDHVFTDAELGGLTLDHVYCFLALQAYKKEDLLMATL